MKLFLLITLLFSAFCSVLAGWSDAQLCGRNWPGVVNAIQNFCRNNMNVPSPYTDKGGRSSGGAFKHWTVAIQGNCQPAQWVPQQYCFSQFYSMCKDMKKTSIPGISRNFGRNGCQQWIIASGWYSKRQEGVESLPFVAGEEEVAPE